MTPAQRLRAAAQLARETAEAATPGPWEGWYDDNAHPYWTVVTARTGDQVATHDITGYEEPHGKEGADAYHIALWSPPVALAVAAWLEESAVWVEADNDAEVMRNHALAVADALLQTTVEP